MGWRELGTVGLCAAAWSCGGDDAGASDRHGGSGGAGGAHACPEGLVPTATGCGWFPDACGPNEIPGRLGDCTRIGPVAQDCAPGFEAHDLYGCSPVLPSEVCGPGLMAVPGDSTCREPSPCGAAPFGDVEPGADAVYVDASAPASGADGSESRPLQTIAAGLALARSTGSTLVAVAAGSYSESVVLDFPVTLQGRCAGQVQIRGPATGDAIQVLGSGQRGVRGVAVSDSRIGISAIGVDALVIDGVHVHDTRSWGIDTSSGSSGVLVRDTLVERAFAVGLFVYGTSVVVERSTIRATRHGPDGLMGRGIDAEPDGSRNASITVRQSVLERNFEAAMRVFGGAAVVEGSVVRETGLEPASGEFGMGIAVQTDSVTGAPCDLQIRGCFFDANHDTSIYVSGSRAVIEGTVVRGTLPTSAGTFGIGVGAWYGPPESSLAITGSIVEGGSTAGVYLAGSRAEVTRTIVRDVSPRPADGFWGLGVVAQDDTQGGGLATLTLNESLVRGAHMAGVLVSGSTATIRGTAVLDTLPQVADGDYGIGIAVHRSSTGLDSTASIDGCLVRGSSDIGVDLSSSEADVSRTAIEGTAPRLSDGKFGDGLYVGASLAADASVVAGKARLDGVLVERSGRAGISLFGATVTLAGSTLTCNAFDLNAERTFAFDDLGIPIEREFTLIDESGNACGCDAERVPCAASSAGLEPAPRRATF